MGLGDRQHGNEPSFPRLSAEGLGLQLERWACSQGESLLYRCTGKHACQAWNSAISGGGRTIAMFPACRALISAKFESAKWKGEAQSLKAGHLGFRLVARACGATSCRPELKALSGGTNSSLCTTNSSPLALDLILSMIASTWSAKCTKSK